MKLLVTTEQKFLRTRDGKVWTKTSSPYSYWSKFLTEFEEVHVAVRMLEVESVDSSFIRADGDKVYFINLPYFVGPYQYFLNYVQIKRAIKNSIRIGYAYIFRVPSIIANHFTSLLEKINYPYGIYVVGDPYDSFSPGAIKNPLRPFFRWLFTKNLKKICQKSWAAAYVTEYSLQRRYPPKKGIYCTYFSEAELEDKAYVEKPRCYDNKKIIRLIMVGSLEHFLKSPEILINAVHQCVSEGLNIELVMVGGGKYLENLKAQANSLNLDRRIKFTGPLPTGESVRQELDKSDVFVLPSRQEGLPRAMIEAMARGLPCIGSTVGGIPELLPPEDLVPPGDVKALARKIKEVVTNPERMTVMSARNLAKAREYKDDNLRERRNSFYRYVKEKTEEWLKHWGE
jgi:glycosyltransferase involved in cell wall biosynthesis